MKFTVRIMRVERIRKMIKSWLFKLMAGSIV
jgi:hypothetical protein